MSENVQLLAMNVCAMKPCKYLILISGILLYYLVILLQYIDGQSVPEYQITSEESTSQQPPSGALIPMEEEAECNEKCILRE